MAFNFFSLYYRSRLNPSARWYGVHNAWWWCLTVGYHRGGSKRPHEWTNSAATYLGYLGYQILNLKSELKKK